MKGIATCSKCGKKLTTDCEGCITGGISFHNCNGKEEFVDVVWKEIPETEKELNEIEEDLK